MAKIPEIYNIGDKQNLDIDKLIDVVLDMYSDIAIQLNKKPDIYQRSTNGLTTDTFLSNGDININTTIGNVEVLTSHPTSTAVVWSSVGGGSGSVAASGRLSGSGGFYGTPYNLSASSHPTTGRYTVTFTNPMPNANYAVVATAQANSGFKFIATILSQTITGFTVQIWDDGGNFRTPTSVNVIVVGG